MELLNAVLYGPRGSLYMHLIAEAMNITRVSAKSALIKTALANLITKASIKDLMKYYGKIDLDINPGTPRKR